MQKSKIKKMQSTEMEDNQRRDRGYNKKLSSFNSKLNEKIMTE